MTKLTQTDIDAIKASDAFLPTVGKGSGWLPQPEDGRDFMFAASLSSTPVKTSIREYMPRVRDQGQQGSCTGFATAYAVGALVRMASQFETVYSPQYIYNIARHMIGYLQYDSGAYIRDAVKTVNKYGAARERDFMYYELEDIQFELPPEKAYESARSWKLGSYRAISNLTGVKAAIAGGSPVVGGFLCYENLGAYSTWQDGIILPPSGACTGGHAVCFTGYDDEKRLVQFINSWGSYWGDEGYGYLPYSYFEGGLVSDIWALSQESIDTQWPRRAPLAKPA